jgi:3'-phosphoadenosine 5'-phosphosulfate sulfotransferase (PAPS reductase)/FAD synthetase
MSDPFKIDGPTCLSLSGGRTSAYMLNRTLRANGGFMGVCGELETVFANTGREAEATLEFVRDLSLRWLVPIHWVEYRDNDAGFAQVDFASASREGEPFEAMIRKKKFLPNPVARFCTVELKIRPTELFLKSRGWTEWDNMLGFRADEPLRVAKVRAQPILPESPGVERLVPLAAAGIAKADIRDFWAAQDFDLTLPMDYDGTTIDGNCDGCFLKPAHQRVSAMQRNPSMPVWWIAMEELTGGKFTKDGHSYREMAQFAKQQTNMFDPTEEAIACFCGD